LIEAVLEDKSVIWLYTNSLFFFNRAIGARQQEIVF